MVTLSFALLAHGFGVPGTFQPHRQAVSKKTRTVLAEGNLSLFDLLDVKRFEGKGGFFSAVILPAENAYKLYECSDVRHLFFRNLFFQHLPALFKP